MDYAIKCKNCGKAKHARKFLHTWQREQGICDYCAAYGRSNFDTKPDATCSAVTKPKKDKRVLCLKCSRIFSGRVNVRLCSACKRSEEYKDDVLKEYLTADTVK